MEDDPKILRGVVHASYLETYLDEFALCLVDRHLVHEHEYDNVKLPHDQGAFDRQARPHSDEDPQIPFFHNVVFQETFKGKKD